ncbi:MAG: C39 family peptidase [Erysipelotrichaceae bacterium]
MKRKIINLLITGCCLFTITTLNVYAANGDGENSGYLPGENPGEPIEFNENEDSNYVIVSRPNSLPNDFREINRSRGILIASGWATDRLSYYKQGDYPYDYYSSNCSDTIAKSGCALTALSSVISRSYKYYDPPALAKFLGAGSFSGCFITWDVAARKLGLPYTFKDNQSTGFSEPSAKTAIRDTLDKQKPMIVSMQILKAYEGTPGFANTHYVVCYGYETYWNDDGTGYTTYYYIHNPGGWNSNSLDFYMDKYFIRGLHIFE